MKHHVANFTEQTNFPGGCPVLNTAVDADYGNPVLRERVRLALQNWRDMLIATVKEGRRSGTVRPDTPRRPATRYS